MSNFKPSSSIDIVLDFNKHLVKCLYPNYIANVGESVSVFNSFLNGNEPKNINVYEEFFIPLFQVQHSSEMPDSFILVKVLSNNDDGSILQRGVVELCIYAKNLPNNGNGLLPNLTAINNITKMVYDKLTNTIFSNISITNIRSTIVSDQDNGYHYNSLIINNVNIK